MAKKQAPRSLSEAFKSAEPRPAEDATRSEKKNYAERLSRELARVFADHLRATFPGVLPTSKGEKQESKARTTKGFKKLDVNYSTTELGLALGVSIKTINFRDKTTGRFTKNYTRNENELRSEAMDYHKRQPWAVLVAIIFLPDTACDDAGSNSKKEHGASSFGSAVRFFRNIAGRRSVDGEMDRFEGVFLALYGHGSDARFFDVEQPPPKSRRPTTAETFDLGTLIERIRTIYDTRNSPPFIWADDAAPEVEPLELEDEPES